MMIISDLQKLLEQDLQQLDSLADLLREEKACLEKRDLETLIVLLQKKQMVLGTLEQDNYARRQLLTKAGLKDDQVSLPNLRKLLSRSPDHLPLAELIENIEKTNRSFYGGAIGVLDFEGNFNHAIMIRSFLSKNHTLHFQAGAGIVESSSEENEMQEVYNKLGALQKALDLAENI
jgi:flagellar biosynthesis/type III secretory pathway chaperone